jgi:Na+-translocating ferredoxin:NAD+ oxidoreductase RnfC subunit
VIEFCQWLQATPWSTWLRESTWGYPIIAAIHVLGIAWFGGAVLKGFSTATRIGLAFMTVTGAVLFYMAPVHCYESYAFRIKMLLLAAAVIFPRPRLLSFGYWIGMIFAGRGIAFF